MARRNKRKIYSIILVNHGKQLKTICSDTTEVKIYKKFNELLKENKKVSFPIQYNSLDEMVESEYELEIKMLTKLGMSMGNLQTMNRQMKIGLSLTVPTITLKKHSGYTVITHCYKGRPLIGYSTTLFPKMQKTNICLNQY